MCESRGGRLFRQSWGEGLWLRPLSRRRGGLLRIGTFEERGDIHCGGSALWKRARVLEEREAAGSVIQEHSRKAVRLFVDQKSFEFLKREGNSVSSLMAHPHH